MSIKRIILSLVFLFVAFLLPVSTLAAGFNQSYIRLNRNKQATSPLPILVTASPVTSQVENNVKVEVGSAWSISTTASNFTVSTSNLPTGIVAWPGINTASGVTGNVITFPCNDLNTGTVYGFFITGGITLNPSSGNDANYLWHITTANDATEIDSSIVNIPVINNDQVTITAEVPLSAHYFSTDITSSTTPEPFAQNTVIDYQIKYGSTYTEATTLTIQAQWSNGTLAGESSPSVDILDYVVGSASDAYNSTPAVVDLNNKTITWTVTAFPANTENQTVNFQLKTNEAYTGSSLVNFTVSSRIITPVVIPDDELTQTYLYQGSAVPTATPTSAPSTTTVTPTPTPATAVTNFEFSAIKVVKISPTQATIVIETTTPSSITMAYGLAPSKLTLLASDENLTVSHLIKLDNLKPNTNYYFIVTAKNSDNSIITSDVFVFKTAFSKTIVKLLTDKTFITSQNLPIHIPVENKAISSFAIPLGMSYEITVLFENSEKITNAYIEISRTNNIFTNLFLSGSVIRTKLFELKKGEYTAKLTAPFYPCISNLFVSFADIDGNLENQYLTQVYANNPLTIFDEKTKEPVESAKLTLYSHNLQTKVFELIKPNTILANNPSYSDYLGQINVLLPVGIYKAEIEAFGYKAQTLEFEVYSQGLDNFPQIYLQKESVDIISWLKHFWQSFLSLIDKVQLSLTETAKSKHTFNLINFVSMLLLSLLLTLALSFKTKIPLKKLPGYLRIHLQQFLRRSSKNTWYVHGLVINKLTKQPICGADINFFDCQSNKILAQIESNYRGFFHQKINQDKVKCQVNATDYLPFETEIIFADSNQQLIKIELEQDETFKEKVLSGVEFIMENVVQFILEFALAAAVLLNFFFIDSLGFLKVLPSLILSIINMSIYLIYLFTNKIHQIEN